ncbi:hypothetical protein SOCEGT47_031990 [Sorangium cellulosum]|uniref:Uncharacterized protein n=1 Tax=Sorangium cellulosum TaxID=56 RepID=A0A4P2Q1G7_SORCE|nr:hypothetical protein [Sorangium cellulosum]AUX22693.1 hypothetical protein SOCEGT47_031990 [Sorangium cellulosum]
MGTIIALTAILVPLLVVGMVLFFVFRRENAQVDAMKSRMAELDSRMARASLAQATVVSSRTRGTFQDGSMAFVDLRLEVQPPGGAPYLANTEWELNISSMSMVEPGKSVAVKIDGEDPEIIYPNVSWARLSRTFIARGVKKSKR